MAKNARYSLVIYFSTRRKGSFSMKGRSIFHNIRGEFGFRTLRSPGKAGKKKKKKEKLNISVKLESPKKSGYFKG